MSEISGELLQAIYDAARERFDLSIRNGDPQPVGSDEIVIDLLTRGYQITQQDVKTGFHMLERAGIVGLGNGGTAGKCCKGKPLFIEDFFR
jgi:hypothetical protein